MGGGSKQKNSLKSNTTTSKIFPDSSSDSDEASGSNFKPNKNNVKLQFNKNYAERYDKWRNQEELMKMQARYGSSKLEDLEKSSEESSSSSDEEEWSPEKEKEFYKTLANLKKKDPKIYDPKIRFFSNTEEEENQMSSKNGIGDKQRAKQNKKKKSKEGKPFLLKDHERTMILEKGGLLSDEEEDQDEGNKPSTLSYYEQLNDIKKGFSKALKDIESDDGDESDSEKLLMKRKPKSEDEKKQDDEDYRLWLKGELKRLEKGKLSKDEEKELGFLRSYWNDDKLDEGEKFLRDYILNRNYIEPKTEEDNIPSYNEIVHDSDEGGLSNDEQFEEQREEFEHKYNFRFEEPDPEFIKRFPRTIQDSLRREDERRKKQRESAKDRKREAKDRKREEVQRLKAMKRKEIIEKLKQLQEISGDPELALEDLDIDGDFDPEEYDKKMQKVFNEKYYEDADESSKPEFPFDPAIDDEVNWEQWVPADNEEEQDDEPETPKLNKKKKGKKAKNLQENNSSSSEESAEEEIASSSKNKKTHIDELIEASKGRKSKKKSLFMEILEKKKPKFDPKVHKSFDKYFKEYYALDFEDLVGDLPCRFKYREVVANDFGLTTKEILEAEDQELNQWASLKKTYQYRAENEEKYEQQEFQKKAQNEVLKKRILPSIVQKPSETKTSDASDKKPKTSKKSSSKRKFQADETLEVEDDRLKAYGLNPKKYKKWVKYGGK